MTTSEILKAAKARLTPETWGKGDGTNDTAVLTTIGRECAALAIDSACGNLRAKHIAIAHLTEVACGHRHAALHRWNDAPERTLQDVLDAFEAAIAIAEAQEAADPVPQAEAVTG